jgi:LPS sulfotransferase NodH
MSGIKRLYWEEIEKINDENTPDLDELKEFVNPDEYPSDPLKEDEENYLKFVRSTMETNENIYTTEIISKQGELIADAAYMSEQEASQLKSIVQKIDPTSIVHIRSRKVKAESARDICDYVNGESTDKFFSDVPIEESSLIDMLDKLNPFSK